MLYIDWGDYSDIWGYEDYPDWQPSADVYWKGIVNGDDSKLLPYQGEAFLFVNKTVSRLEADLDELDTIAKFLPERCKGKLPSYVWYGDEARSIIATLFSSQNKEVIWGKK